MAYRVEIAKSAESDLDELYLWVIERAPTQGATSVNGLERAILSLDQHPERCPVAPENIDPDSPDPRSSLRPAASRLSCILLRLIQRPRLFVSFTFDAVRGMAQGRRRSPAGANKGEHVAVASRSRRSIQ